VPAHVCPCAQRARDRARARARVCVCVSREDGGDAKNREARKKCASAPAKWKHFFDRDGRQSTVTLLPRWSLRFLKSRAPIRCNKMSAKSGDGARDVRAGRLKAERLNPSGAGRELARRAVLWRQREILSWKLKPQFKCPCLSLSLSLSLSPLPAAQRRWWFPFEKSGWMPLSLKFSRENYRHRANDLAFSASGTGCWIGDPSGTLVKFQPSRIVRVRLTNRSETWVRQVGANLRRPRYASATFGRDL
jgi:hypothetical protein